MNRLAQLDDTRRRQAGSALVAAGLLAVAFGIIWAHYALFPNTEFINGVETEVVIGDRFLGLPLGSIPRHWLSVTIGQIIAFAGSQFVVLGLLMLFVMGKPMTWARAGFTALIAWFELVMFFGVVPSEWLNLTQGPLGWTSQKVFFSVPESLRFLVLNNELTISYAVVKDAISGLYHMVMLGAAIVFAYQIQDFGKVDASAVEETPLSPYGRPLIKGSR